MKIPGIKAKYKNPKFWLQVLLLAWVAWSYNSDPSTMVTMSRVASISAMLASL